MSKSWFELESDPGLFTSLVEDFGIRGVQVDEIYDVETVTEMDHGVFGFIFLFRWIEETRRRRRMLVESQLCVKDKRILDNMFFAHQVIPNSCATHALLSILLNSEDKSVKLSQPLLNLKTKTKGMTPEQKGEAIGDIPTVAAAHNSYASPHLKAGQEKPTNVPGASQAGEAYHYVSFIPINGHLYEMDGLKPWPLDHGKITEDTWTEKFHEIITDRLGLSNGGGDIMFNLMAVVPDKRIKRKQKLDELMANWKLLTSELDKILVNHKANQPNPMATLLAQNGALTVREWIELLRTEHNYTQPETADPYRLVSPMKNESSGPPSLASEYINELQEVELTFSIQQGTNDLASIDDFEPFIPTHIRRANVDNASQRTFTSQELIDLLEMMECEISSCEQSLKEEEDLRDKYKMDSCRRTHNYFPFITTFLRMLSEQGMLTELVNQQIQAKKITSTQTTSKKRALAEKKRTKLKRRKQ